MRHPHYDVMCKGFIDSFPSFICLEMQDTMIIFCEIKFEMQIMELIFMCSRFQIFRGNTNAYNHATIQRVDNNIRARAVKFIPLDSVVQACMRIQICGKCKSSVITSLRQ